MFRPSDKTVEGLGRITESAKQAMPYLDRLLVFENTQFGQRHLLTIENVKITKLNEPLPETIAQQYQSLIDTFRSIG